LTPTHTPTPTPSPTPTQTPTQTQAQTETQTQTQTEMQTETQTEQTTKEADPTQTTQKVVQETNGPYHVIIVDVDSKDVTVGMSCPPASFLEKPFLDSVKALLHSEGLAIFNLACRSKPLLESTLAKLGNEFAQVCAAQAEEDINKVVMCLKRKADISKVVKEGVDAMAKSTKKWDADVFDVKEMAGLIEDIASQQDKQQQPQQQQQQKPKKKGGKKNKKKGKK